MYCFIVDVSRIWVNVMCVIQFSLIIPFLNDVVFVSGKYGNCHLFKILFILQEFTYYFLMLQEVKASYLKRLSLLIFPLVLLENV